MALEPGDSMRVVCPFCGGGSSQERSMSIKRDSETGLILYHCFRAHCSEGSGVLGGAKNLIRIRKPELPRFIPWNEEGIRPLDSRTPPWVYIQLRDWGLWDLVPMWGYDPRDDRLLMPIRGPLGEMRGWVRRRNPASDVPKVLMGRVVDNQPMVSYVFASKAPERHTLVCVEDIPSAWRVSRAGVDAVALLGCTPSDEVLDEIRSVRRRYSNGRVVFALDPDATSQALSLARKYGLRGAADVLILDKDFKNMTKEEAAACLKVLS